MIGLREETDSVPLGGPSPALDLALEIFNEGGFLAESLRLSHRPQQEAMALAVAEAVQADEPLLFEAGTGVGKSLAYLIPGIIHAVAQSRQLVVSTHTISLQEQIEKSDLPICRRLFSSRPELKPYAEFKAAVLVGKSNYLCTTRLAHAIADRATLLGDADFDELQRLQKWAAVSETGLRHELKPLPRPEVWELVNADSAGCARKYCDCDKCFYQRARARVRAANIIVVNHSLLFALISAGGARADAENAASRGVLFPNDFVVLDEAHTVPAVATDNFGLALSSFGLDRALKFLYNPRTKRGIFKRHGGVMAQQAVADALEFSRQFFSSLEQSLLTTRATVRLREQNIVEDVLEKPLGAIVSLLEKIGDKLADGRERDEVLEQKLRVVGWQAGISEWLTLAQRGQVYWAERGGKKQDIVTLRSAPIDVAPELRKHLFGCATSVICTSATLAIAGEMAPFAKKLGADHARAEIVASPFEYARVMRVYVAADIPLPSPQEARLALEVLADYIQFCVSRVPGGSLVLFTSYSDMRAIAMDLEEKFRVLGRPFLMQGSEMSRTELTQKMRELGNAVLFGTDSFWTGVDVPGAALSQVIITRLPFDPPTDPITEARCDLLRENGENPFNELTLPEALIKFRQGVGRLIRSHHDRGAITLLDSRVLAKSYGRLFLASLPQPEFVRITRENRGREFHPFA